MFKKPVQRGHSECERRLVQGASLGEEAVLADSGWAGEVAARVGRVRSLAFLSILLTDTWPLRWGFVRQYTKVSLRGESADGADL